ncbi:hypothetical protein L1887_43831 [Cichorium endivia]|nr:hypothetical protein L1887_43831 [Cichorium endivia]
MPSFDIVSEVDIQEVRNGVENATREVESRFDFRGVEASFELNDANKTIKVLSESDFQAQIQGEEIRVTGKSRDDLQSVMALVRGGDLGQPFQFKNFRD